ncbi:TPR and ankyrin repeat-containing protein 1 [Saguinus oedipus]|uniref:TPR and ankyrin repeat-containing protein 1 n=1 Tax=Saguinus oedipus TaxID=9490 RepID=A0ABQ9TZB2_SAGOE|nr:TPR and ankyrin repeat-containing protein 1 [Saguinus oedipus]
MEMLDWLRPKSHATLSHPYVNGECRKVGEGCSRSTFFRFLLEKQKWPEVLLLLTRKVSGEPPLGDCFIKDCNFSDLDICTIIPHLSTWDQRKTQLLGCLIDSGASILEHVSGSGARNRVRRALPDGLQESQEKPLVMCLKHEDFELAFLLLTKGADPRAISLMEGDTPLHAALHIFLEIKAFSSSRKRLDIRTDALFSGLSFCEN